MARGHTSVNWELGVLCIAGCHTHWDMARVPMPFSPARVRPFAWSDTLRVLDFATHDLIVCSLFVIVKQHLRPSGAYVKVSAPDNMVYPPLRRGTSRSSGSRSRASAGK